MKLFSLVYILATALIVLFRIDSWPISNFSMFRAPQTLEDTNGCRWLLIPSDGKRFFYEFPASKIHDSFSWSLRQLESAKAPNTDTRSFIEKYIGAELRISGLDTGKMRVEVLRARTKKVPAPVPGARSCWSSGPDTYCVLEERVHAFAL